MKLSGAIRVFGRLQESYPGLGELIAWDCRGGGVQCGWRNDWTPWDWIQHLNDEHLMTRETIADIVEGWAKEIGGL